MHLHHFLHRYDGSQTARAFDEHVLFATTWPARQTVGYRINKSGSHGYDPAAPNVRSSFLRPLAKNLPVECPIEKIVIRTDPARDPQIIADQAPALAARFMALAGFTGHPYFWMLDPVTDRLCSLFIFFSRIDPKTNKPVKFASSPEDLNALTRKIADHIGCIWTPQTAQQIAEKVNPRAAILRQAAADQAPGALPKQQAFAERTAQARHCLPIKLLPYAEAERLPSELQPTGFARLNDASVHQSFDACLRQPNFTRILAELGKLFNCDRKEICLVETDTIQRDKTTPVQVLIFNCDYNPAFNDLLKTTEHAKFRQDEKSWTIPRADWPAIQSKFAQFFSVFVYLGMGLIYRTAHRPAQAGTVKKTFLELPYHIPVSKKDVVATLCEKRKDPIDPARITIHDGAGFVAFPADGQIFTQMPFLLLRHSAADGPPRYASFSTIANTVEPGAFAQDAKSAATALARYIDTCQAIGVPAFITNRGHVLPEVEGSRDRYHAVFTETPDYEDDIEEIHSVLNDIRIAPLSAGYVTLATPGPDPACVATDPEALALQKTIAAYFGYSLNTYPIVFTPDRLPSLAEPWNAFKNLIAGQIARLIAPLAGQPDDTTNWAIRTDILSYLFTGQHETSTIAHHLDKPENAQIGFKPEEITEALQDFVFPFITKLSDHRIPVCKEIILAMTSLCLARLNLPRPIKVLEDA